MCLNITTGPEWKTSINDINLPSYLPSIINHIHDAKYFVPKCHKTKLAILPCCRSSKLIKAILIICYDITTQENFHCVSESYCIPYFPMKSRQHILVLYGVAFEATYTNFFVWMQHMRKTKWLCSSRLFRFCFVRYVCAAVVVTYTLNL